MAPGGTKSAIYDCPVLQPSAQGIVSPERCRSVCVWSQPTRPHHARPWLPVHQRIHVKLGCSMYKSLSGQAPQYLADNVQLVADSGRRLLRSASDRTCVVPPTHNSFGVRSFSAARPRVWNALPQELRQDTNFGQFRRKVKSHLFV